jgi:hypothetical protein
MNEMPWVCLCKKKVENVRDYFDRKWKKTMTYLTETNVFT